MKCKLVVVPKGWKVVPEEPTEDMIYAAGGWTEDEENAIFAYKDALDAAPQLDTPPVLRWEGDFLLCGNKILAGIIIPEYEGDGITWFISNEQPWHGAFSVTEARRAAEKALGFPDGLIIEEV